MKTMTRWQATGRWIRRGTAVLGLTALIAGGGLRQDEIDCEQAVSFLQGCCPDWAGATVSCVQDTGCGTSVSPALSIDESQCILAESCAQVVQSGLCERVKNLVSPSVDTLADASTSHPPVCP
jgi:hypothetical protein